MQTIQEIAADIAKELREQPSRWTTGCLARDASGRTVPYGEDTAVCWCLMGHLLRRAPNADAYRLGAPFFAALGLDRGKDDVGFSTINDDKRVEDIIALCDQVAAS